MKFEQPCAQHFDFARGTISGKKNHHVEHIHAVRRELVQVCIVGIIRDQRKLFMIFSSHFVNILQGKVEDL